VEDREIMRGEGVGTALEEGKTGTETLRGGGEGGSWSEGCNSALSRMQQLPISLFSDYLLFGYLAIFYFSPHFQPTICGIPVKGLEIP